MDGSEKEAHFGRIYLFIKNLKVGLFGGIIGEIALLMKALIEIGSSEVYDGLDEVLTLEEVGNYFYLFNN